MTYIRFVNYIWCSFINSGLTGTSSLFECCPNVAAVAAVIIIVKVAFVRGVVVVAVIFVVPVVFSRYGFTELFVHVEKLLLPDSFVLPA